MLTVGSLFSGVGGLELGLERAGMEVRWQVEIDDYCRRVLAKHWPAVQRHTDVREVGAHNLEPVDLVCGGFPCQDISYAGKGAGLEGERSGLWYEFARVVREMGPRYVLVENSAALLTRGLDAVLGTLAACGYDAEWDCIPAAAVGAHHQRDRAFVVAYPQRVGSATRATGEVRESAVRDGDGIGAGSAAGRPLLKPRTPGGGPPVADDPSERCRARRSGRPDPSGAREPEQPLPNLSDAERGGPQASVPQLAPGYLEQPSGALAGGSGGWSYWTTKPDVGRVADGVPARVDRLRALGNAVVPQVAEWIGRRIVEADAALRESEAA